jgi:HEAT repeat protein
LERLLLNFDHKIDVAGEYSVEAVRYLSHATDDVDFFSAVTLKETLEVRSKLYFRIDDTIQIDPNSLQQWVDQLRSPDPMERSEAARTLASLAPKFLEETLLTFADAEVFRQFAPLAFHRLNTKRSIAALAGLLKKTEPGMYEHLESAKYLADSNDLQWFPLLLEIAQKNARIANYVDDAARLGGDKMLPALMSLSSSPDKEFTRVNAVTAIGYTGARAAVPVLLEYLRSSDKGIAERALYGLRLLTHRTEDAGSETPGSEYPAWAAWWAREGSSAPIYKSTDCGDFVPLP